MDLLHCLYYIYLKKKKKTITYLVKWVSKGEIIKAFIIHLFCLLFYPIRGDRSLWVREKSLILFSIPSIFSIFSPQLNKRKISFSFHPFTQTKHNIKEINFIWPKKKSTKYVFFLGGVFFFNMKEIIMIVIII